MPLPTLPIRTPIIVLCACAVFALGAGDADARLNPAKKQGNWLAKQLSVPTPDAPWRLKTAVAGQQVEFEMPRDLARVPQLPLTAQRAVNHMVRLHPGNLRVLGEAATVTEGVLDEVRLSLLPEHDQTLREIALTVDPTFRSGPRVLYRYEPILRALPRYTAIEMFVPALLADRVRSELRSMGLSARVRLHPVAVSFAVEEGIPIVQTTTPWARDQMEVVRNERGVTFALLPLSYNQIQDLTRPDNSFVHELEDADLTVVPVPLFFKSGNLAVVRGQRRVLFLGEDELRRNEIGFQAAVGYQPSRDAMSALLRRLTGADTVEVIPNSRHFFHLDMAMTALREGVVGLASPLDREALDPEDTAVLDALAVTMARHGIRTVRVPTLARRVSAFQSPVNAVPFRDPRNGQHTVLVPEFPDVQISVDNKRRSLNALVRSAYRNANVAFIPVQDRFSDLHGNTHCVVMSLN